MYSTLKLAFICAITMYSSTLFGQKNIDQVFRKYKNDQGVVNLNFTGDVLKMLNESDAAIKSKIEGVEIIIFKKGADIATPDKAKVKSLLTVGKYDLLVDIKNKSQKVQVYAIDGGQFLNKVYAQVNLPDMNAYFILSGNIIFEELAKLGMDFQNSDGLKVLGNKKTLTP